MRPNDTQRTRFVLATKQVLAELDATLARCESLVAQERAIRSETAAVRAARAETIASLETATRLEQLVARRLNRSLG